jgi:hypothetical protein
MVFSQFETDEMIAQAQEMADEVLDEFNQMFYGVTNGIQGEVRRELGESGKEIPRDTGSQQVD